MTYEHQTSAPPRTSLPRTLLAAGTILLTTVCGSRAATPDSVPSAPAGTPSTQPARETLRGTVASMNERNDTLTVRIASTGTSDDFKVLDGLIFNSVRDGDSVEITVETTDGVKTIVALTKQ